MVFIRKTKEYLLHLDVTDEQIHFAQSLRHNMTEAERILWNELKGSKLKGLKFRRQHPIHYYIADFYCHKKRFIIEVDGGIHSDLQTKDHDGNRTAEFERLGIKVIRFTNEQVLNSIEEVINSIIHLSDSISE